MTANIATQTPQHRRNRSVADCSGTSGCTDGELSTYWEQTPRTSRSYRPYHRTEDESPSPVRRQPIIDRSRKRDVRNVVHRQTPQQDGAGESRQPRHRLADDYDRFVVGNLDSRHRGNRSPRSTANHYPYETPGEYDSYRRGRHYSTPVTVNRGRVSLQLESYSGKTSFRSFLLKFENFCDFYNLSESESISYLKQSLSGNAIQILWKLHPQARLSDIITALRERFGEERSKEHYRQSLRTRRQQKSETLEQLFEDILRLSQLAFDGEQSEVLDQLMTDSYIYAVSDEKIRQRLLELGPKNIYDAHNQALRLQSIFHTSDADKRNIRTVQTDSELAYQRRIQQLESQLTEMAASLKKLTLERDAQHQQGLPNAGKPQFTRDARRATRTCYLCNEIGHFLKNCPKRGQNEQGRGEIARTQANIQEIDGIKPSGNQPSQYLDAILLSPSNGRKFKKHTDGSRPLHKDTPIRLTLDSGADFSVWPIKYRTYGWGRPQPIDVKLYAANGEILTVDSQATVYFEIGGKRFHAKVIFSNDVESPIMSLPWLQENRAKWCMAENIITLNDVTVKLTNSSSQPQVRRVVIEQTTVIPPNTITHVKTRHRVNGLRDTDSAECWFVDATRLAHGSIMLPRTVITSCADSMLQMCNYNSQPITLKAGSHVAYSLPLIVEKHDVQVSANDDPKDRPKWHAMEMANRKPTISGIMQSVRVVNAECMNENNANIDEEKLSSSADYLQTDSIPLSERQQQILTQLMSTVDTEISDEVKSQIEQVLRRRINVFSQSTYDVGTVKNPIYDVQLADPSLPPVSQKPRIFSEPITRAIQQNINEMLNAGIVQVNETSRWRNNVVAVLKKSENGEKQWRIALDLRETNLRLIPLTWPSDQMTSQWHRLSRAKWFAKIDITQSYFNIGLSKQASEIFTFCAAGACYNFLKLPNGARDANSCMARAMFLLRSHLPDLNLFTYVDDIVLPINQPCQGVSQLDQFLEGIQNFGFKIKWQKTVLFTKAIDLCGYRIFDGTVKELERNIQAILRIPLPSTKRALRGALGKINFYRSLHENLAEKMDPFNRLLKGAKNGPIKVTQELKQQWELLLHEMSTYPTLHILDVDKPIVIKSDASDRFVAAVIGHMDEQNEFVPCGYFSKKLTVPQVRYEISTKELFAFVQSLKHWRGLILGAKKIIWYTDSQANQFFLSSNKELTPMQARWLSVLTEYGNIETRRISGSNNRLADWLSRDCDFEKVIEPQQVCSLNTPCKMCEIENNKKSANGLTTDNDRGGHFKMGQCFSEAKVSPRSLNHTSNAAASPHTNAAVSHQGAVLTSQQINTDSIDRRPIESECTKRIMAVNAAAAVVTVAAESTMQLTTVDDGNSQSVTHVLPCNNSIPAHPIVRVTHENFGTKSFTDHRNDYSGPKSRENDANVGSIEDTAGVLNGNAKRWLTLVKEDRVHESFSTKCDSHNVTDIHKIETQETNFSEAAKVSGDVKLIDSAGNSHETNRLMLFTTDMVLQTVHNQQPTTERGRDEIIIDTHSGPEDQTAGTVNAVTRQQSREMRRQRIAGDVTDAPIFPSGVATANWSPQNLRESQRSDPVIGKIISHMEANTTPSQTELGCDMHYRFWALQMNSLCLQNGILYRKFFTPDAGVKHLQFVVPLSLCEQVMSHLHVIVLAHAKSFIKNAHALQSIAIWWKWKHDLKVFLSCCVRCEQGASRKEQKKGRIRCRHSVSNTHQRLCVDLMGPFKGNRDFSYVLSAQDAFSKKLFLYKLKSKRAEEVASKLIQLFLSHGFWTEVHSDSGGEFRCQIMNELVKCFGSYQSFNLFYTPRENLAERCHSVIHRGITKCLEDQAHWPLMLPVIEASYNGSVHQSHQFSPNEVFYGRQIPNSLQALLIHGDPDVQQTQGEFMSKMTKSIRELHQQVLVNLKRTATNNEMRYNKHLKPEMYEVGSKVLYFCPRVKKGTNPKWNRYFAPATVEHRLNDVLYSIKPAGSRRNIIVHLDKLRRFPPHFVPRGQESTAQTDQRE